jgi:hypothetical protein
MNLSITVTPADARVHNHTICSHQWATRPASERFWTIQDLRDQCIARFEESLSIAAGNDVICVEQFDHDDNLESDLALVLGPHIARFTHWSFGQLANRLGAPAWYLRTLPSRKTAELLNFELQRRREGKGLLWIQEGLMNRLLAITSDKYCRIPSHSVCDVLLSLPSEWQVPPGRPTTNDPRTRAATEDDVLSGENMGLSIEIGDLIAPAGVYGDDRSMFVFMVNQERAIEISPRETLYRGFYIQNSEVGASSLTITAFDYQTCCGNHIIWGCRNVREFRIRHVGERETLEGKFMNAFASIHHFIDADTTAEREMVVAARKKILGSNKEEVASLLQEKKILSLRQAGAAYDLAEAFADIHGAPNTVWGMVSGVTRLSQLSPFADAREELDRTVGRLLALVTGATMQQPVVSVA